MIEEQRSGLAAAAASVCGIRPSFTAANMRPEIAYFSIWKLILICKVCTAELSLTKHT